MASARESKPCQRRMCRAACQLRDGHDTVRQIAGQVGYDSEFAFARAFKRATGSAPGQYRVAHCGHCAARTRNASGPVGKTAS
jgi:AraC-like DNA-binding protein